MVPITKFLSLNTLKFTIACSYSSSQTKKNIIENTDIKVNTQIQGVPNQSYCWPLSRTICIFKSHNTRKDSPTISTLLLTRLVLSCFIARSTSISDTIPAGRLIINIHCHDRLSTRKPPTVGPRIDVVITANANTAIARPFCSEGNACSKMDCDIGIIGPPPIPWITRPKISMSKFCAIRQIIEPHIKIIMKIFRKFFLPIIFSNHPVSGSKIAFAII